MEIITKNIINNRVCPLYHHYPSQPQPQPACIELDCMDGGNLMADWIAGIGVVIPRCDCHGSVVRWELPATVSSMDLRNLFADEGFLTLCRCVLGGFKEVRDSRKLVGHYTESASAAIEAITDMLDGIESLIPVCAHDYVFSEGRELNDFWSSQSLDDAVAAIEDGAAKKGLFVDGNILLVLLTFAEDQFFCDPEDCTETHIATLLENDCISEDEAEDWLMIHTGKGNCHKSFCKV